jgi:hypothetical protein
MQLFTVHFTTKHIVSRFDDKGVKIGEYEADIPQTVHALPRSTAETYKKFGNWRIEPYYADVSKQPVKGGKQQFNFRGTSPSAKKAAPKPSAGSAIKHAARTGDLAAAISAGAKA